MNGYSNCIRVGVCGQAGGTRKNIRIGIIRVDTVRLRYYTIPIMDIHNDTLEIMTLPQVAAYLQLAEKTVLRMAQRGDIPAAKVASQWRFLRPVIRDWLAGQMQSLPASRLKKVAGRENALLPLREVVRPSLVKLDMKPGPKESVLRQLVEPLTASGFIRDGARLLKGLLDREAMMTTAIGHKVALPHPRRSLQGLFPEPAVVVGICPEGTDFDAVDDQWVHLFFLICATREEIHLRLMATVGWLVRRDDLMTKLRSAASTEEVIDQILAKADQL